MFRYHRKYVWHLQRSWDSIYPSLCQPVSRGNSTVCSGSSRPLPGIRKVFRSACIASHRTSCFYFLPPPPACAPIPNPSTVSVSKKIYSKSFLLQNQMYSLVKWRSESHLCQAEHHQLPRSPVSTLPLPVSQHHPVAVTNTHLQLPSQTCVRP